MGKLFIHYRQSVETLIKRGKCPLLCKMLNRAQLICALLLSQLVLVPLASGHPVPDNKQQTEAVVVKKRSPGLWKKVAVGAAIGVGGALLYHAYKNSKSGQTTAAPAAAADDGGTDEQPANLRRG
uniref:Uncharacterized protein n=1 Tax=Globodera rostochiensis TaxID=31243 RepID=A0A914HHS9_GLORO